MLQVRAQNTEHLARAQASYLCTTHDLKQGLGPSSTPGDLMQAGSCILQTVASGQMEGREVASCWI